MSESIFKELELFIRQEIGLNNKKPLLRSTRLYEDLGQAGDDANEFMGNFFKNFSVKSGDFDFHRYFLMEGEGLLFRFLFFFNKNERLPRKKYPVTLGMLEYAVIEKYWDSERLESHNFE